jgi:catechol 2,3-dioxygenase-like lactoylglutathione lyase family enzyme
MTLGDCELIAFSQTTQAGTAKAFYGEVLGLKFEDDNPFAIVFHAGRTMLRIQKVEAFSPLPFSSLGWKASDISTLARQLIQKGVTLSRFEGLVQDEIGIWISPTGAKVCWFRDPDGNLLSLTQFP